MSLRAIQHSPANAWSQLCWGARLYKTILPLAAISVCQLWFLQANAKAEVVFLGSVSVPGDTPDLSGLEGTVGNATPHNLFGAISGLEHVSGNQYLALPDRGPLDGASQFQCRCHLVELTIDRSESLATRFQLLKTTMLKNEDGRPLIGALEAFDLKSPSKSLRFDPEAVRVTSNGATFISDEYGPFLYEFDATGLRRRVFSTPSTFSITHLSSDPEQEEKLNVSGRAKNGGWEGLAITPDETNLMLATQKSLLQDGNDADGGKKKRSRTLRFLDIDLTSGNSRQFAYQLEQAKNGISELLAINDKEFLVLERDGFGGIEAHTKRIYRINTDGATDVTGCESLPGDLLPENVIPVQKTLLLDLLDPRWGLAGEACPEKWEGLTFGPTLADGRRLLWVAVDNDYVAEKPSLFYAFGIDDADLPGFGWGK